ncbi:restriction endonuclease subunit S [Campylobacter devanensis]|uniref:restriction endonuclease subunit S n=1 Tax=Campylobacter devanensis TaxID=3161138 RepID=UPI000A3532CB|nr:restriction endonuclease subunit S [Campylobacter sp. P0107]
MSKQNMEFKDSGIPWIGQIPKHWGVKRLKFIIENSISGEVIDKGYWNSGNEFLYTCQKEPMFSDFDKFPENKRTRGNCLLLTRNATPYIFIPKDNAIFSNVVQKIILFKKYDKRYIKYSIQIGANSLLVNGDIIPSYNMQVWNNIYFCDIPLNEQKKIAEFLDKKCEIIDKRLSNLERKIKSLKEYKKSLISECVTTGLNPKNMEFKDSGIPWCPQIPSDWQVINPKILFKQRNQKAKSGEIQYTASQEFGIISQEEYTRKTGYNMVKVLKGFDILKHVEVGDFVISMRSFQGGLEYSNVSGSISSAYVMLIPNSKFVNNRYFRWLFKSSKYIDALQSTTNLIRDGQAMRYSNFALIKLIVPSLNEQKEIAEFVDKKCEKIDRLNENYTKQITALKEYKKSLIYECVTGKKEI